jgi:hypothetical protein
MVSSISPAFSRSMNDLEDPGAFALVGELAGCAFAAFAAGVSKFDFRFAVLKAPGRGVFDTRLSSLFWSAYAITT